MPMFFACPRCGCDTTGTRIFCCPECKTLYCDHCGRALSVDDYAFCPACAAMRPMLQVLCGKIDED